MTSLSDALEVNSTLTKLELRMNSKFNKLTMNLHFTFFYDFMSDLGLTSLSEALKVNSSLTSLNLTVNDDKFLLS